VDDNGNTALMLATDIEITELLLNDVNTIPF